MKDLKYLTAFSIPLMVDALWLPNLYGFGDGSAFMVFRDE